MKTSPILEILTTEQIPELHPEYLTQTPLAIITPELLILFFIIKKKL